MPNVESQLDADFYQAIHHLVEASMDQRRRNRRGEGRRDFAATQHVAPYDGRNFPRGETFFAVSCHDLTTSGFSFTIPRQPDFELLVAALGRPPGVIFVAARVVHCRPVLWLPTGEMEPLSDSSRVARQTSDDAVAMFLVGCRFLQRLATPEEPIGALAEPDAAKG